MRIGFCGIGLMGGPMAHRLLDAGHELRVWNRTPSKVETLVARGAMRAATVAEAAVGAELVFTMLSDGRAVEEVSGEVQRALEPGAIWVDTSSIPPPQAKRIAAQVSASGRWFLDAPVSGGTKGAQAGTLSIMVGGEEAAFERAAPVLSALGRPIHVGKSGSGQLAKCANQLLVGVTIAAVAEAMLLLEREGADRAKVREALLGGFAQSKVLEEHGRRMLEARYTPGGKAATQLKDLRTVLEVAREDGLTLPVSTAAKDLYEALAAWGPELDHSAVLLELEKRHPSA